MPRLWLFVVAGAVSACATTPDVSYSYYPVKATGLVTVTQTLDCNSSQTELVTLYSPAVTTSYAADTAHAPYTLKVGSLDSAFADTDFGFNLYDDGRLKSINATTAGQAEATAKAAVSLATPAQAVGGGAPGPAKAGLLPACALIAALGQGKPVSLTYGMTIDYANFTPNVPVNLDPAPASRLAYDALKPGLPLLQLMLNTPVPNRSGARYARSADFERGFLPLTLQEIDNAQIDILAQGQPIYSGAASIPSSRAYQLPIPKAVLFGKQGFSLTLSEAGVVTSIDYSKASGGAGALSMASGAATAAAPATAATRATETQAQADLIVQQQRLARCQANPAQCQ